MRFPVRNRTHYIPHLYTYHLYILTVEIKRNEVITLSKRKIIDVLLAVFAAICMVADTIHDKDSEKEIE